MKKKKTFIIITIIVVLLSSGSYFGYQEYQKYLFTKEEARLLKIAEITSHYATKVISKNETDLYDDEGGEFKIIGQIGAREIIDLDEIDIDENTEYFYSSGLACFIHYQAVEPYSESVKYSDRHLNYVPFDESVVPSATTTLYDDQRKLIIKLPNLQTFPILIKEDDAFGVDYQGRLVWILKNEIKEVIKEKNSEKSKAKKIRTLCYHRIYDQKKSNCTRVICHSMKQIENHFNYLKKNKYFTISMQEMYWFIKGRANMPKNSVCLTFDDGGMNTRHLITLLERYDFHATLFLIGRNYHDFMRETDNLELQAHMFNLHTRGHCNKTPFGAAHMCLKKSVVLADMIKSKEFLNAIAFAYPYYEFDANTIKMVKEAGFLMAFEDNTGFTKVGSNPYKLSRYTFLRNSTVADLASVLR